MVNHIKDLRNFVIHRPFVCIFFLGILFRVQTFIVQPPFYYDNHYEVIQYISEHHEIPLAGQFTQAYHPPLYHVLASFFLIFGGIKTVQLFSLLLSILTFYIYYWLIKETSIIRSNIAKLFALSLR